MLTLNPIFTTYQFDVEVVTPVHVGMAQEKNYVQGLDYILVGNEAWIVNTEKLYRELTVTELDKLTVQLASGQSSRLEPMLKPILERNPEKLILEKLKTGGIPKEIRRFYRTGLGNYAVPGTSLKGAIRSIFLAELKSLAELNKSVGSSRQNDELGKLMGDITNNLMRFIQVGDIDFTKKTAVEVRRTKIFSADSKHKGSGEEGKWKHGNTYNGDNKHSAAFNEDEFVTFYETLVPDKKQHFYNLTIRLGSHLPHEIGRYASGTYLDNGVKKPNIPNYNELLAGRSGEWLMKTIRAHTQQYLEREKAYFAKFENKDLDDVKPIQDRLDELIDLNKKPGSCLLRVGAGVGFHSITGDWQDRSQRDHTQSWIDSSGEEFINSIYREKHKRLKNQIFAKTRKFAFEQVKGVDFALMGFIKLTLQTAESVANREIEQQKKRQQAEEAARLAAEAEAKRLENARIEAEEAKKPKLHPGPITKGLEVDAEVIVSGKPNRVKIYVAGYEEKQFEMIESAQQPKGYICRVALVIEKGKLLRVRHIKPK